MIAKKLTNKKSVEGDLNGESKRGRNAIKIEKRRFEENSPTVGRPVLVGGGNDLTSQ